MINPTRTTAYLSEETLDLLTLDEVHLFVERILKEDPELSTALLNELLFQTGQEVVAHLTPEDYINKDQ